jgi:tetratricopeptide (TPR) repeat protein
MLYGILFEGKSIKTIMKIRIITLLITILTFNGFSQDVEDYMNVMIKQKKSLKMARTVQELQTLADNFEQISQAESDKWHPLYYAAYCYLNMSFINKNNEERVKYLDKAQSFVDKAIEIYPDESELFVLQGFIDEAYIQTDPVNKGKEYSEKATKALEQAIEFNPDNPRAYYLLGLNLLHTPQKYGGGKEAACPYFLKAIEKFKNDIPENVLSPTWGGEENYRQYAGNCKQ